MLSQAIPAAAIARPGIGDSNQEFKQKSNADSGFCNRLDSISQRMLNDANNRKTKNIDLDTLDQSQLLQSRSLADKSRQEHYSKLYQKYPLDSQKAAIDEYKNTVATAIDSRRKAVDDARNMYRTELNKLIQSHQQKINSLEKTIIESVQDAYSVAKKDCSDDGQGKDAITIFKTKIKQAKDNFKSDRQQIMLDKNEISTLQTDRNQKIQTAISEFKKVCETARSELLQKLAN